MTRKERQQESEARRVKEAGKFVAEMIKSVEERGNRTTNARVWLQTQIEIHCASLPQEAEFYRQVSSEARRRFDAWANARAREKASGRYQAQRAVAC